MARSFAFAVAALLAIGAVGCGGVDRGPYVRANERLFAELPRFPRARLRDEVSTAYRSRESGPVVGYGTRFEMTLPTSATASALSSFFRQRLEPQWQLVETLDGTVLNFRQGDASLSVNLDNAHIHLFEIAVDHDYYGKLGR